MTAPIGQVLLATSAPVISATIGASWATYRPPSVRMRSGVQHFAAGLVFAAASVELIPDLVHEHEALPVVIGFAAGIALMLGLGSWSRRLATRPGRASPMAALVVVGFDVFIDGMLIGIGFAEGGSTGLILTVALTVELTFLGLAIALIIQEGGASHRRVIATTTATALLVMVGGLAGATVLSRLHGAAFSGVIAFAVVALLFLVTEELLTEAHKTPDTPVLTAMFFIGFLVLLLLSFATG